MDRIENNRNTLVIFSYNPRISPALRARMGVTRSYLIYALLPTPRVEDLTSDEEYYMYMYM